jgi:hypothetical protein
MKIGKGDISAQRRRRKARYRGCAVCGDPGAKFCEGCRAVQEVLAGEWEPTLLLYVDGSFATLSGDRSDGCSGHGGAGLVLTRETGEVLATRSCAFAAVSSSDAEFQAVIRGARWAPGVVIYTDSESTCDAAMTSNKSLDVRFLVHADRRSAHALAHQLSVEGRTDKAGSAPDPALETG